VLLFMKGNANFPQCGFSGRAIQILKACGVDPRTIEDGAMCWKTRRSEPGIKDYSNWPTIPQLYVKGEFIGGSDIMMEMYEIRRTAAGARTGNALACRPLNQSQPAAFLAPSTAFGVAALGLENRW